MKAVSPMIATILLIAFTVAVGGILSIWLGTLTTTQTATVSNTSEAQVKCVASLKIVEVKAPSSGTGNLDVTIKNTGENAISNIYIDYRIGGALTTVQSGSLAQGQYNMTRISSVSSSVDLVVVRGICSNIAISADCKSTQKCWVAV